MTFWILPLWNSSVIRLKCLSLVSYICEEFWSFLLQRLWLLGDYGDHYPQNQLHALVYFLGERQNHLPQKIAFASPLFPIFSVPPPMCRNWKEIAFSTRGWYMVVLVGRCSSMYECSCSTLCVMSCSLGWWDIHCCVVVYDYMVMAEREN